MHSGQIKNRLAKIEGQRGMTGIRYCECVKHNFMVAAEAVYEDRTPVGYIGHKEITGSHCSECGLAISPTDQEWSQRVEIVYGGPTHA